MNRFVITTHPHLAGVGLSRAGHYGNVRYADDASASEAARAEVGSAPIIIDRVTVRRRLSIVAKD